MVSLKLCLSFGETLQQQNRWGITSKDIFLILQIVNNNCFKGVLQGLLSWRSRDIWWPPKKEGVVEMKLAQDNLSNSSEQFTTFRRKP